MRLQLVKFIRGVNLSDTYHEKRLYQKFGIDGDDVDKVDQQIKLCDFVRRYKAGS